MTTELKEAERLNKLQRAFAETFGDDAYVVCLERQLQVERQRRIEAVDTNRFGLCIDSEDAFNAAVRINCRGFDDGHYADATYTVDQLVRARTDLENAIEHLRSALRALPDPGPGSLVGMPEWLNAKLSLEDWRRNEDA